jgi:hypothetical protein
LPTEKLLYGTEYHDGSTLSLPSAEVNTSSISMSDLAGYMEAVITGLGGDDAV